MIKQLSFLLLSIMVAGLLVWYTDNNQTDSQRGSAQGVAMQAGTYLSPAKELQAISLIDHNGDAFTKIQLQNKWSFIFFGYTNCPDICPTALGDLNRIANMLDKMNTSPLDVQYLFISVDPERDTPEKLKEYVKYFNPGFIGLSGTKAALDGFTRQLNTAYFFEKKEATDTSYNVSHSSAILLLNPQGALQALFSVPHNAKDIAQDFLTLVKG